MNSERVREFNNRRRNSITLSGLRFLLSITQRSALTRNPGLRVANALGVVICDDSNVWDSHVGLQMTGGQLREYLRLYFGIIAEAFDPFDARFAPEPG